MNTIMESPDVSVRPMGTIVEFDILSPAAAEWIEAHVSTEEWQWYGSRLMVDVGMASALLDGMRDAGLAVA